MSTHQIKRVVSIYIKIFQKLTIFPLQVDTNSNTLSIVKLTKFQSLKLVGSILHSLLYVVVFYVRLYSNIHSTSKDRDDPLSIVLMLYIVTMYCAGGPAIVILNFYPAIFPNILNLLEEFDDDVIGEFNFLLFYF